MLNSKPNIQRYLMRWASWWHFTVGKRWSELMKLHEDRLPTGVQAESAVANPTYKQILNVAHQYFWSIIQTLRRRRIKNWNGYAESTSVIDAWGVDEDYCWDARPILINPAD